MEPLSQERGYDRPVEIAAGIHWIGFHERLSNLHCNPYLIVEGDQVALIDPGSRPDFPVVMLKMLQTGVSPEQVVALIYQHFDPDLCGSMSNMLDLCTNPDLKIVSDSENNLFLSYYIEAGKRGLLTTLEEYDLAFPLGGRTLQFFKTPYAHSAGSFVTYDPRTGTLFTSDLFGSLSTQWDLFLHLEECCRGCTDYTLCPLGKTYCPLPDILAFHRRVMPSEATLRHAMAVIRRLDPEVVAPQHGSILTKKEDVRLLIDLLTNLQGVGIDGLTHEQA